MKLHELIEHFDARDFRIQSVGGKLRVTADDAELTDEVVGALKTFKKEVSAYYADPLQAADPAVASTDVHPLSFAQRRLYFLYQYDRSATYFNLPIEFGLAGRFDVDLLRQSIEAA